MNPQEKERVSEILSEQPKKVRVGWLSIKLKPLTLSQIYELGSLIEKMDSDGLDGNKIRLYAEVFHRYKDTRLMQDIYITSAFRSRLKRKLWGWYIRRKLTLQGYEEMLNFMLEGLDANFFLTSIISLKRTAKMTEPN